MMSADKDFAAVVLAWQHKFGALNQMVGSVEPRPEVWERIKAAIGHSQPQSPTVLPESVSLSAIAEAMAAHGAVVTPITDTPRVDTRTVEPRTVDTSVADASDVIQLAASVRRWRMVATATSAIAAALVAMIGVGVSMPDLLPDSMRPEGEGRKLRRSSRRPRQP